MLVLAAVICICPLHSLESGGNENKSTRSLLWLFGSREDRGIGRDQEANSSVHLGTERGREQRAGASPSSMFIIIVITSSPFLKVLALDSSK